MLRALTIYDQKIIINFGNKKLSKKYILKILRQADFSKLMKSAKRGGTDSITIYTPIVKVGLFDLHLVFTTRKRYQNAKNLRSYGKMYVKIYWENGDRIFLTNNEIFANQYWVEKNLKHWLRIIDLVEVIYYLS